VGALLPELILFWFKSSRNVFCSLVEIFEDSKHVMKITANENDTNDILQTFRQ